MNHLCGHPFHTNMTIAGGQTQSLKDLWKPLNFFFDLNNIMLATYFPLIHNWNVLELDDEDNKH